MANLLNFNASFKAINYREVHSLSSEIFLAHYKVYGDCLKSSHVQSLTETYQGFIDRVVQEVKSANQQKVELLQIDVKKSNIAPEAHNLTVIAQALYREYGIELKQVDRISGPTVMVVSWNRDNPLFNSSAHQFKTFRGRNFLTDFQIKCKEKTFSAHKLVLASACPFFEKHFSGDFKALEEHLIPFENAKADSVEAWLDYLYTGNIKVSEETVSDLIQLANYYGLGHLKQKCFDHLCKTVNATNLVQFISYGLAYEMEELEGALVKSVQSEISLENLEAFLDLIQNFDIKNLETICLQQIEKNFRIGYSSLAKTRTLLEIADQRKIPEIKVICNRKFENMGMYQPTFELVFKWLTLASEHSLDHVTQYCTKQIPNLLRESNDILNEIKQLLQLADQYQLAQIKEICTDLLIDKIEQDLEKIVVLAQKFNLERLKEACERANN